jgi:hypothetical protein
MSSPVAPTLAGYKRVGNMVKFATQRTGFQGRLGVARLNLQSGRNSFGSLAMLTAMRRALSRISSLAAEIAGPARPPGNPEVKPDGESQSVGCSTRRLDTRAEHRPGVQLVARRSL